MQSLERIEINQAVLLGKPVIKGTRLSVQFILGLMASGADFEEILDEYKDIGKEDILACLKFASESLDNELFMPLSLQTV
mgnify:FL=1